MLSVTYASCSPWRTSTIRSPGSGNAARSSSARWSSTKTRIGSATSGVPKEFSSGLPKSSGSRLPDERCGHRAAVGLLRKHTLVDPGDDSQSVLVVQLLQYLIRQVQAVEPPEGVALAVVGKILVRGLQRPEIRVILRGLPGILAEQHPVLVADQELAGHARLPPQVVQHGADLRHH